MTAHYRLPIVLVLLLMIISGSAVAGQDSALLGTWYSEKGAVVFNKNGTLVFNNVSYQYTAAKGVLTISGAEGVAVFSYQLSQGALTFTANDGTRTVYTRKQTASSSSNAAKPSGSSRAGSGDISGKWCYMSNIYASNGGSMSNRCFTLNPNGTYGYYGESSSSGQYGSSASQSSDQGTWTATATTLTANSSRNGKRTYRLEKKNHPKTHDPMLVIEGEAYVTYYQKPSW